MSRLPDSLREVLGERGAAVAARLGSDPEIQGGVALGFDPATQQALQERLASENVPGAQRVAEMVTRAAHDTFLSGLDTVFVVAAAATVVAGALALLVRDRIEEPADDAGDGAEALAATGRAGE